MNPRNLLAPVVSTVALLAGLSVVTNLQASGIVDVIGNLSTGDFNTYIAPQTFRDWGNEPCIAVNPLNPQQVIISSFGYASFINNSDAQLWCSTNGGATWSIQFSITPPPTGGLDYVDDQTYAFDNAGVLHCAMLTYVDATSYDWVFHGSTTNVTNSSAWTWTTSAISATNCDQPWIAISSNNVAVGYDNFNVPAFSSSEERVAISTNRGVSFPTNLDLAVCSPGRVNTSYVNPGLRVASDKVGDFFMICGVRTNDNGLNAAFVNYRLNRWSGGTNWDFTKATSDAIGGLYITNGTSRQGNYAPFSFGRINYLLGNITAVAANTNGSRVYTVCGLSDASNIGHLYLQKFVPSGTNLVNSGAPLMFSSQADSAALPEVAVADNGVVGLLFDEFDGSAFHIHFAVSLDGGNTIATNRELYAFSTNGMVLGYGTDPSSHNRLLGDYQVMRANSNSFYASFAARGNVSSGNITTNFIVPFFYSYNAVALPTVSAVTETASHNVKIDFTGTPGGTYFLQAATNALAPVFWQTIYTNAADADGKWSFTNSPSAPPTRFFRAYVVP
jgi:hypothetical protein